MEWVLLSFEYNVDKTSNDHKSTATEAVHILGKYVPVHPQEKCPNHGKQVADVVCTVFWVSRAARAPRLHQQAHIQIPRERFCQFVLINSLTAYIEHT